MNDKPVAYIGLVLVLAGFLLAISVLSLADRVEWLRHSREGATWAAFAMCIVGCAIGLINRRTAPGKVASYLGGILVILFLVWLLTAFGPTPPASRRVKPVT